MMYVSFIHQKNSIMTAKFSTSVSTERYPDTKKVINPNNACISIDGKVKNTPIVMLMMNHRDEIANTGADTN